MKLIDRINDGLLFTHQSDPYKQRSTPRRVSPITLSNHQLVTTID